MQLLFHDLTWLYHEQSHHQQRMLPSPLWRKNPTQHGSMEPLSHPRTRWGLQNNSLNPDYKLIIIKSPWETVHKMKTLESTTLCPIDWIITLSIHRLKKSAEIRNQDRELCRFLIQLGICNSNYLLSDSLISRMYTFWTFYIPALFTLPPRKCNYWLITCRTWPNTFLALAMNLKFIVTIWTFWYTLEVINLRKR